VTHEGLKEFLPGAADRPLHNRAQRSDVVVGQTDGRVRFAGWLPVVHRNPFPRKRIHWPTDQESFSASIPVTAARSAASDRHSLANGTAQITRLQWSCLVNCREALELMGEYVDGVPGLWNRRRLQLHIWICGICRRYLSSYRATIRIAKATRDGRVDSVDDQIPDSLIESILEATPER
jgi:hypothetical protein